MGWVRDASRPAMVEFSWGTGRLYVRRVHRGDTVRPHKDIKPTADDGEYGRKKLP